MSIGELVIPPPTPKLLDYPVSIGIAMAVVFTTALLFVAGRFDSSGGVLTISILVVLAFCGAAIFCMYFTVPSNEITSGIVGGLIAAFGAVVSYWLNHPGRKPPE